VNSYQEKRQSWKARPMVVWRKGVSEEATAWGPDRTLKNGLVSSRGDRR
jgi:hypothetical protein